MKAWPLTCRLLWAAVTAGCTAGCRTSARYNAPAPPAVPAVHFTEIARQAGIDFHHVTGAAGKKYLPETTGSGVAFLDYDNDGWQDVLFVNSTSWPGAHTPPGSMRLYHNERNGKFSDVTARSGLSSPIYGMGAAVGDYDNDGFEDVYITALGPNHLFRNTMGDRRRSGPIFREVTDAAGLAGVPMRGQSLRWKWSTSAAWLDYDRDGKLDLFVCNYVQWSPATDVFCGTAAGKKDYCTPNSYQGCYCTLYHNEGSGRFRDVSAQAGIDTPQTIGKSFGVAVADFNGDGWPDIAVSNDNWPNFLFLSQNGKRFTEEGLEAGIAFSEVGKARAGMGIDALDWQNSGSIGLVIGDFTNEALALYSNDGRGLFTYRSHDAAIATPSLLFLTFGVFGFDFDLDGWQDIFAANGHIANFVNESDSMLSYRERPLLYHNDHNGRFTEVGEQSGLTDQLVARGAAYADIDNDGDLDVAVVSNGDRAYLYRNDGGSRNHWIRFREVGKRSNRDGIGARIRVTANGVTQTQIVHSGGSYLSESQRAPTFGLAGAPRADSVEVTWPSGTIDRATALEGGREYVVEEGEGFAAH